MMINQLTVAWLWQATHWGTLTISRLRWYDYDRPGFCGFKGEGKEHRGDGKEKREEKKKREK